MFIKQTNTVIEISDTKLDGFEEIADDAFAKLMVDGIEDPDIIEAILETLQPVEADIVDLGGDDVKGDDPLGPVRGLNAEEINKAMNKQPMLDMIEAATGTRPPTRTKAAELAEQLEKLAAGTPRV